MHSGLCSRLAVGLGIVLGLTPVDGHHVTSGHAEVDTATTAEEPTFVRDGLGFAIRPTAVVEALVEDVEVVPITRWAPEVVYHVTHATVKVERVLFGKTSSTETVLFTMSILEPTVPEDIGNNVRVATFGGVGLPSHFVVRVGDRLLLTLSKTFAAWQPGGVPDLDETRGYLTPVERPLVLERDHASGEYMYIRRESRPFVPATSEALRALQEHRLLDAVAMPEAPVEGTVAEVEASAVQRAAHRTHEFMATLRRTEAQQ